MNNIFQKEFDLFEDSKLGYCEVGDRMISRENCKDCGLCDVP